MSSKNLQNFFKNFFNFFNFFNIYIFYISGPTAASAPPPLKSNMYSLRPSVSSVAPNSTYGIHGSTLNTLVRGPTPQAVRPGKGC